MYAPPKSNKYEVIHDPAVLESYDAVLFGIPTRYGNFSAQFKAFWDMTGKQWQTGAFWGKYAGLFVSTASQGGGQESTAISSMSTLVHHGFIFVPLGKPLSKYSPKAFIDEYVLLGYKTAFPILADLSEVRGGSPWGAGTFAVSFPWGTIWFHQTLILLKGGDGSRQPTVKELELAMIQGESFYHGKFGRPGNDGISNG